MAITIRCDRCHVDSTISPGVLDVEVITHSVQHPRQSLVDEDCKRVIRAQLCDGCVQSLRSAFGLFLQRYQMYSSDLEVRFARLCRLLEVCDPPVNDIEDTCVCLAPRGHRHARACPVWQDAALKALPPEPKPKPPSQAIHGWTEPERTHGARERD